jgi:hypothetical protein
MARNHTNDGKGSVFDSDGRSIEQAPDLAVEMKIVDATPKSVEQYEPSDTI